MLRYVAFAWDSKNPAAATNVRALAARLRSSNPCWTVVVEDDGLSVLTRTYVGTPYRLHTLSGVSGIVLGIVFPRTTAAESPRRCNGQLALSPRSHAGLRETKRLITDYWGSYIALLRLDDGRVLVIKSPMGDLPCYHCVQQDCHVFFSSIDDYLALGQASLSVNWSYVAATVVYRPPMTRETGLTGVTEVEGGECVTLREGMAASEFYWNPCAIAAADSIDDMQSAAGQTRSAVQQVVGAWASVYPAVLHKLSGGLDSSVVLAALRCAPSAPRVWCITNHSKGGGGDERDYARAAASRTGCALLERERNFDINLEVFHAVRRNPRPVRDFTAYESHAPDVALCRSMGATAIFSGALGDAIFDQSAHRFAAADFLLKSGPRCALASVALDAAHRGNLSVWRVLRHALRASLSNGPGRGERMFGAGEEASAAESRDETLTLASAAALLEARCVSDRFAHPWFQANLSVPPGKRMMIASLAGAEATYNTPFAKFGDPPLVSPLASAPLVELCLRIATHLAVSDGMDRAVVRTAFRDELPPEIVWRSDKGSPGLWTVEVIKRNIGFVRDFLLDGALAQSGLLDRAKMTAVLADTPTKLPHREAQIIRLLYNEAWLRHWVRTSPRPCV